ncbi:MAG: hypothetical protein WB421_00355 [Terriglobales bacterium]
MARLVCFAKSPLAKGFISMLTGKKDTEIKRSDLDCIANENPPLLVSIAVGGKEVFLSLRNGALEFDKFFDGSDYTIKQMEEAILTMNVRNTVLDFYSNFSPGSFFSKHKKWIIGGAGTISCIITIFVVIHVRRTTSFSQLPSTPTPTLKRKRKRNDVIPTPATSTGVCDIPDQ